MLRRAIAFTFCGALSATFGVVSAANPKPNKPIWAKKGVTFPVTCLNRPFHECRPLRIPSPDGNSSVEISYDTFPDYPEIEVARLRVVTLGKYVGDVKPVGIVDSELSWSPDSTGFFINGNDNGNGDDYLAVHLLNEPALGPGYITRQVEEDMARSFPPCEAKDPIDTCAKLAADPKSYIAVVGLDWINKSSGIVVMAEVPCSGSMGGIMCQVLGYEIEVPSGNVLRRMEAKEFARRWQHSMAWKFQDIGPAELQTKVP
jgi:hypothetical protein